MARRRIARESSGCSGPSGPMNASNRHSAVRAAHGATRSVPRSARTNMFGNPVSALAYGVGSMWPSRSQANGAFGMLIPDLATRRNVAAGIRRPVSTPQLSGKQHSTVSIACRSMSSFAAAWSMRGRSFLSPAGRCPGSHHVPPLSSLLSCGLITIYLHERRNSPASVHQAACGGVAVKLPGAPPDTGGRPLPIPDAILADVGRAVEELATPALVLDRPAAARNMAVMAEQIAMMPAELRPHIKAHKSAEIARLQVERGAIGITAATVAEADAMALAGLSDILIANEVVASPAIDRVVAVAVRARTTVAVDDVGNLQLLASRAAAAGALLGVVVEVDVGMGRGGARTTEEALALAGRAAALPGIELRGLMGYEGHCADERDVERRERKTRASMAKLMAVVDRCSAAGLGIQIVTAGATGTYRFAGGYPGVTEVQAGSYVLMDRFHEPLAPEFECAIAV